MTEEKNLRALVHTVQMKSAEGAREEDMKDKPYLIKDKLRCTQRGFLYPINPNKLFGELYSYSDLTIIMESIKEGLGIGEWEFDRIDLAVDSVHNYDDTFKINKYLISLASLYLETKNFTDTRGGIDLKKRSLKVWKRKIDIEIYDKKLESAGLHPYTRCEFRFKLLDNKRKEALFEELYVILDGLKECIDKLNIIKTQALYKMWHKEKKEGKVKNINEFYRKYSDEIYTVEISKSLFEKIRGRQSDYKSWIGNIRRSYKLKFVSKRRLNSYISEIKMAVKEYEETSEIEF